MKRIEKVSIIGLGAIGSYYADRLKDHVSLKIVAGGERAERLKKDGMIINGRHEFFDIADPAQKGDLADLVIIIPKMPSLRTAIEDVKNQIGEDTIIMAPLNGIESEDVVRSVLGGKNVLYSLVRISSVKKGNAVDFEPNTAITEFGEKTNKEGMYSENVEAVKELFERASMTYKIQDDMVLAQWLKFVCNVSENQVTAVLSIPFGAWWSSKEANELRLAVAAETIAVARRMGIMIDEDYAVKHLDFLKKFPPQSKTSMHQDILAGRHTEKDMLSGTVIRLGKEYGVATPYNEFLYRALCVLEEKNDGKIAGV